MNTLVIMLADGTTFLTALALASVAFGVLALTRSLVGGALPSVFCIAALVLGAVSSSLAPAWMITVWYMLCLGALALLQFQEPVRPRAIWRFGAIGLVVVWSVALGTVELTRGSYPAIPVRRDQTVYVIGDSLSAGVRRQERNWPDVLGDMTGLTVVNLAVAGATAESAMSQVGGVEKDDGVVFLEIGGNDFLRGTSDASFHADLEALIQAVAGPSRRLVMFELPIPLIRSRIVTSQRELAAQYDIVLIPRGCLADAMTIPGGNIDYLHFSQVGHDHLAALVAGMIVIR